MGVLRNIVFGMLFTLLLVVFLAVTRLIFFKVEPKKVVLTQLKTIHVSPPPEPLPVQSEEQNEVLPEVVALPSPSSLADLRPSIDVASLAIPDLRESVPLDLSVDLFSLEIQPVSQVVAVPKQKKSLSARRLDRSPVKFGGEIGMSDLDANPSIVRRGRFRWPRGSRSEQIKAVVKVELNEKGNVRLLEVKLVSDETIRKVLPAIVNGSKFSVPKKNGKPVKIIFHWPLILKKP